MKNQPLKHNYRNPFPHLAFATNEFLEKKVKENPANHQKQWALELNAIVFEVQERERKAIGMELHDNVNQILVSTKLLLSAVETTAETDRGLLSACMENLQHAIDENRRIAHEMVAPDFKEQKLAEQVESIAATMLQPAGVTVHLDLSRLDESKLHPQQKLVIYRVIQEQCTNIIRYAESRNVRINMSTCDSLFRMTIVDDGKGIDPAKKKHGIGLQNIQNRVSASNGTVIVHSEPGKGFSLEVEMPLAAW